MQKRSIFGKGSLILIPLGIAINIIFAKITLALGIPLYLDSIGTVLAAALGGWIPGIVVGFFSNFLNGLSDPITMYYGIISIILAACVTLLSSKRCFTKFSSALITAIPLSLIGGGLGSVLTWLLYGFSFGQGITAPYAHILYEQVGMSQFWAQFTADMAIDFADKLITVAICFAAMNFLPDHLLASFKLGHIYSELPNFNADKRFYRKRSLRYEVVSLIIIMASVLGITATLISFAIYTSTTEKKYIATAAGVVEMMKKTIDPDRVSGWLESETEDGAYIDTEKQLEDIRSSFQDITYMYVYRISEDGCHVVFDLDTPELTGEALGSVVEHDEAFGPYRQTLLDGGEIEPIISNETYGWLLTVYKPLYDSEGKCVAYAAADISMEDVISDRYVFIIKMASLLFGTAIVFITATIYFAEKRLISPINSMTEAAYKFAYDSAAERVATTQSIDEIGIKTGDEIENLYNTLTKTAHDVASYITDINAKADAISRMQTGIIIAFADMVENRDECTGAHIKHTSGYVGVIAEQLKNDNIYPDIITEDYIADIVKSAPLHDIGKIKISDSLLNKPGKLTPEEFDLMKTHTTVGRQILQNASKTLADADYLSEAINMAGSHHERWDGKGYPDGVAGEAIPLSARIMAVADVFDALISKRSYKEPFTFDKAVEIISEESGTHFDPQAVNAFIEAKDKIKAVADNA